MKVILDIHSKKPYPASKLSNFAHSPFSIGGLEFHCMEGFLQSLKESNPDRQAEYQWLSAREAKVRGSQIHWQNDGMLFWRGVPFSRYDWGTYRTLLIHAYDALAEANPDFQDALLITGRCLLWHSIGKFRRKDTCLTTFEFLYLLYRKRKLLRKARDRLHTRQ